VRHLVSEKAFERDVIEQLYRLLADDDLASPVYAVLAAI